MRSRRAGVKTAAIIVVSLLLVEILGACATGPGVDARSRRLPDVELLSQQLAKGISTKADVRRVLGEPNGRGGALSKLQPDRPRELWIYSEMGWSLMSLEATGARVHVDQQLLMVFFDGDVLDGYWWHSNAAPAKAKLAGQAGTN